MLDSSVKKLSASVSDFDIILATPSVTIPAIATKSIGLQANLRLVVDSKLEKVKDIQFRFVGGVVISLTTENEYFYNSERLFDQTIIVSDLDNLEPKTYEFPISLSLPTTSSPSIFTPNVRIQYLCVAVVGFENGCCGLVPILQQEPVRVKREIRVNNEGLLPGFKSRCISEDMDLMSLIGNSLIWSPNDDFLLELGPSQTTVAPWHLMCQVSIDYVIERVDYKIVENSAFIFT